VKCATMRPVAFDIAPEMIAALAAMKVQFWTPVRRFQQRCDAAGARGAYRGRHLHGGYDRTETSVSGGSSVSAFSRAIRSRPHGILASCPPCQRRTRLLPACFKQWSHSLDLSDRFAVVVRQCLEAQRSGVPLHDTTRHPEVDSVEGGGVGEAGGLAQLAACGCSRWTTGARAS
jgi:hypothetical protein